MVLELLITNPLYRDGYNEFTTAKFVLLHKDRRMAKVEMPL